MLPEAVVKKYKISSRKVVDLYWVRSFLHVVLDECAETNRAFLLKLDGKERTEFDVAHHDNEIVFNISNTPPGEPLIGGKYVLCIDDGIVLGGEAVIPVLEDRSKIVRYLNRYAYIVDFFMDEAYSFYINTDMMMRNTKPKRMRRLEQAETLRKKIVYILRNMLPFFAGAYYRLVRLFAFKRGVVLFLTENNDHFINNLGALYEDFVKNGVCVKKFAHNILAQPGKRKRPLLLILKEIYLLALADVVMIDDYTPMLSVLHLDKKVRLVQVWHAALGFKSVGYARPGWRPYTAVHRRYTDAFVDCEAAVPIYSEIFGLPDEKVKVFQMPRLEGYLAKETIQQKTSALYKVNPLLETKKTILFAPTFRGSISSKGYYDMSKIDLDRIYRFCEEKDFLFIIKMHPYVKNKVVIDEQYRDRIFDYTHLNINDLLYLSDLLITDYSTCAYEYSFFNRSLILYRYDKTVYEYLRPSNTLDSFMAGFPRYKEVFTFDGLMDAIEEYSDVRVEDRFSNMDDRDDTGNCEKIREYILQFCK